jgi:predicted transcriptional regulator
MKYNIIIKPEKFDRFTIIPSYILRHKGISIGATGLYAWLFSHKSDQEITVEFICGHFKENQTAIRNKINELIEFGYLKRDRIYVNGKIAGMNYILNDIPLDSENLNVENLNQGNQAQSNINNNIYNKSNINVLSHFIDLFPKKFHPKTDAQIKRWETIIDQLQRLDGYDIRQIYKIVKYIRNHHFWKNQFLSLPKLRNVDKNGDKWIHRFDAVYSEENKPEAYNKIKNLIEFKIYNDPDGKERLGAITKNAKLNEYNLSQLLDGNEIIELIKYLKNE